MHISFQNSRGKSTWPNPGVNTLENYYEFNRSIRNNACLSFTCGASGLENYMEVINAIHKWYYQSIDIVNQTLHSYNAK